MQPMRHHVFSRLALSLSLVACSSLCFIDGVFAAESQGLSNAGLNQTQAQAQAQSTNGLAGSVVAVNNPEQVLQEAIAGLQKEINTKKTQLAQNPEALNQLVNQYLMPIVYIDKMAAMTLGPKWRSATAEERKEFIQEFSAMLTRTYSKALLQMGDYEIKVFPLRGDQWKRQDYVAVSGTLSTQGGGNAASSVTYYMAKEKNLWKVYDFALEGVSFVKNFRSQFEQYPDMKTLLARMKAMNASARAKLQAEATQSNTSLSMSAEKRHVFSSLWS